MLVSQGCLGWRASVVEGQEAGEYFVVGQVGGPAVGGGDGSIEGVVEIVEPAAGGAARVVEIGEHAGLQNGGGFFIPGQDAVGETGDDFGDDIDESSQWSRAVTRACATAASVLDAAAAA